MYIIQVKRHEDTVWIEIGETNDFKEADRLYRLYLCEGLGVRVLQHTSLINTEAN
jgi:hypothetical protein